MFCGLDNQRIQSPSAKQGGVQAPWDMLISLRVLHLGIKSDSCCLTFFIKGESPKLIYRKSHKATKTLHPWLMCLLFSVSFSFLTVVGELASLSQFMLKIWLKIIINMSLFTVWFKVNWVFINCSVIEFFYKKWPCRTKCCVIFYSKLKLHLQHPLCTELGLCLTGQKEADVWSAFNFIYNIFNELRR